MEIHKCEPVLQFFDTAEAAVHGSVLWALVRVFGVLGPSLLESLNRGLREDTWI